MLIAKHTLRLINFTFVVGLTKLFSQILDPIDLLLRFFFGFKKVKILLKWLYSSLFQLDLRLGCAHFYFKPQNRKNKIKNIIIKIFFFGVQFRGFIWTPGAPSGAAPGYILCAPPNFSDSREPSIEQRNTPSPPPEAAPSNPPLT